jgi:PAS domain S-box-containing protein
VQFNAVPLRLAEATVQSTEALLREVMLMSIANDRARHTAEWAGCGIDLGPLLNALEQATGDTTDVVVHFPNGSGAAAMRRLALAEEGQRLALEGKLLSPPSLPEIDVCRQWLMNQIAVQEGLGDPVAWQMPSSLATLRPPSGLSEAERQRYDQQSDATVLVDDGHAIMYVNTAATALLGWNRAELMGQRLVKLIPPELHDAHLGGFMRYLLTSTPKIMHRDVELPVVRGDGTRATFGFHIQPLKLDNQRTAFHAHVWELSDTPS